MTKCTHPWPELTLEGPGGGFAECEECGLVSTFSIDYDGWIDPDTLEDVRWR